MWSVSEDSLDLLICDNRMLRYFPDFEKHDKNRNDISKGFSLFYFHCSIYFSKFKKWQNIFYKNVWLLSYTFIGFRYIIEATTYFLHFREVILQSWIIIAFSQNNSIHCCCTRLIFLCLGPVAGSIIGPPPLFAFSGLDGFKRYLNQ